MEHNLDWQNESKQHIHQLFNLRINGRAIKVLEMTFTPYPYGIIKKEEPLV